MPCPTRRPACDDSPYECCLRSGRRLFPVRGNASACLCLCLNLLGATAWAKDAPASTGERAPTDSGGEHEVAADSAPAATPESSEASAASTDADAASASYDLTIEDTKGRPVRDARLEIPQLRLTATPKDDGSLQLDVPSGTYEVVVRAPGFAPYHERVEFGPALRQTGLAIYLAYDLGEVVVTGSTVEQLASQSPVRTQVIDRSSIERKGAANLAQALKHQTGVRLENDCQNCNFTQVRMNGMDGRYSQIVINGRPVFSALAGVYGLEQIPTEMIDRIEIVKGGSSALYGGSAIAGVINVVTKRPDRTFASLNLGGFTTGRSWGGHQLGGNAGVVNQDKSLALVLSGSLRSREAWDRNGDGFSDLGMHRQHSFSGDLFWDPIPRGTLTLRLQTLGERRRGGDHLDQPEFNVAVAEAATTLRQGGELRWKHTLRSGLSYELGYTMAYTTRDSYYGGGGNVTLPENPSPDDWEQYWAAKGSALGAYGRTRNPVHYGDALVRVPLEQLGEALLTAGMQVQAEQLRDAFPAYSRKVDAHYSDIAAVTELDWHPSTWSEAVLGLRVGKHSSIGRVLMTPRAAVTFTPWSWLKTRTSFSTGYRAPQVFDEDLHITIVGGEGAVVTNVPGLEPERSYSVSQQVESTLPVSAGWSLRTSVSGFANYLTNAFVLTDVDNPATAGEREFSRRNLGSTLVYGEELEASLLYRDSLSLRAGWTLERGRRSEPDPDFGTREVLRTPVAYGFFEVTKKLPYGFAPFTAVDLTGPMKVPHYSGYIEENRLEESPWFFDWDLGLHYTLPQPQPRTTLSVIGRNLLDSFQRDLDRGALRDAGYVYGPTLPRSLWFSLRVEI